MHVETKQLWCYIQEQETQVSQQRACMQHKNNTGLNRTTLSARVQTFKTLQTLQDVHETHNISVVQKLHNIPCIRHCIL